MCHPKPRRGRYEGGGERLDVVSRGSRSAKGQKNMEGCPRDINKQQPLRWVKTEGAVGKGREVQLS